MKHKTLIYYLESMYSLTVSIIGFLYRVVMSIWKHSFANEFCAKPISRQTQLRYTVTTHIPNIAASNPLRKLTNLSNHNPGIKPQLPAF